MFEWLVNGEAWLFNGNRKAALEDSFKTNCDLLFLKVCQGIYFCC